MPRKRDKTPVRSDPLTCKPLDSYSEILSFLENPPPWRTLCKELTPHSDTLIQNIEINGNYSFHSLESPEIFCHFDPDVEDDVRYHEKGLRKTLVCHDLANGYHDDCMIDGTGKYEAYTFYNWAGIDIFCYFSHHLITIPPLGWINTGHAHGVKVIGTVITEWADGITFWDQVLTSELEYCNLASALVAIAKTLKFDGWLLNVENKIAKPQALLEFVRYLHELLHQELPHAVLVWYDSVTVQGNLSWQNSLNEKNKAFFDVCDGFFTNYSWTVQDVQSSAAVAEERVTDLYIGIDVWGRNFYGGGQFNTQEAIKVAYQTGCSMAIFAPAWTQEAQSSDKADNNFVTMAENLDSYGQYLLRDRALWGSIWPFLNTRVPCQMPFQSSFCRGMGKKRRLYGETLSPMPWYNLRHQQYQPNAAHGPHGYMLSTADKITKVSRTAHYKGRKGIIKVRSDFQMIRNELHSTIREDYTTESPNSERDDEDYSTDSTPNKSDDEADNRYVKKTSMRDAFKNLFKPKAVKIVGEDEGYKEVKDFNNTNKLGETVVDQVENKGETVVDQVENKGETVVDQVGNKGETVVDQVENNIEETNTDVVDANEERDANEGKDANDGNDANEGENANDANDENAGEKRRGVKYDPTVVEVRRGIASHLKRDSLALPSCSTLGGKRERSMVQVSVNLRLSKPADKTRFCLAHVALERQCLELYLEDSFIGGSCLRVNPSDKICSEHRYTRLFYCDFKCEDTLVFCVVTKVLPQYAEQTLNVHLFMRNANDDDLTVVLTGRNVNQTVKLDAGSSGMKYMYPYNIASEEVFQELRTYLLINEPGFYVPVENSYYWVVRYYQVCVPGSRLMSINLRTGLPQGGILLGHFGVCHRFTKPVS